MSPPSNPNRQTSTKPASAWHGPKGEILVVIQMILFLAFALAPAWNPWLSAQTLAASEPLRYALLLIFALAALALGLLGAIGIRHYLTPMPYPVDHSRLVTDGAYALVRHPLYSSLLFAGLAWVCWTLSLAHLALLVLGFLFFDYKARKEEHWLTERHPEYPQYARRVRKLVPWVY